METNFSFWKGKHLSPVTKKQIDEFVKLQRKSVTVERSSRGLIEHRWKLLETTVEKMVRKQLKR